MTAEDGASSLAYEDRISLIWLPTDRPPRESQIDRINDDAGRVLQTALAWADRSGSDHSIDDDGSLAQELARIELKLNMVLDLIGRLVEQHGGIPPPVPVRLTAETVSWRTPDPPAVGATGTVSLFLLPNLPRPLDLPAGVTEILPLDDGAEVTARFQGLLTTVQAAIERLVFRQHRRRVARARGASPSGR